MFLVGLTGSIATGKSTVSSYLQNQLGLPVIDADKIAREVVRPKRKAWQKIREAFGSQVFHDNQELNREKLGQIIFNDQQKRKLLNSITHPEIYKDMLWSILKHFISGHQLVVLDLPLLFETGNILPYCSYVITVTCTEQQQLTRLMNRNNYKQDEALSRIQSQMPLSEKVKKSTHIIDNSGEMEHTFAQLQDVISDIQKSRKHWKLRLLLLLNVSCLLYGSYYVYHLYQV